MVGEPDKDGLEGAIDADFEPAPAADYVVPDRSSARSGPGWFSLGLVGALSVAALGFSAYSLNQSPANVADVTGEISTLQESQAATAEEVASVRDSVAASEKRMAAEIEALLSGGEGGEGLEALVAELEAVSSRLDDAMPEGGDTSQVEELEKRLSVLEDLSADEAISPGQATSVLAPLRARIETLETENADIAAVLEEKTEALEAVTARIEDMERALQSSDGGSNTLGAAALADLQSEFDTLKATVERAQNSEAEEIEGVKEMLAELEKVGDAEQKADAAQETATAALALSRIEAAAREGRSFHAAYKQLSEALPGDAAVERLAPIARAGAPTMRQLSQSFSGDMEAALEIVESQVDDGWGWTRQVFGGGVKVRSSSAVGGPRDLLETADQALKDGDLKAAISALNDLPAQPKEIMADWLSNASARLELQDALDDVGVRLIGRGR